jgi:hypothetical protein
MQGERLYGIGSAFLRTLMARIYNAVGPFGLLLLTIISLPLRLLTLDKVVLDLTDPIFVFAHGQLYTSLSRVRRNSDIRMLLSADNQNCQTPYVVHHQLLL